jgi:zinc D-Ala-D-Ala carboxypeptidase
MRLSQNFNLAEFTRSAKAAELGIDNKPEPAHMESLRLLCVHVLQPLREHLGRPISITSGYRSPALNAAVGGAKGSQHSLGQAADIKVGGIPAEDLARIIATLALPVDQCIWYAPDNGGQVHVSFRTVGRRQFLRSPSKGVYLPWPG